VASVLLKLRRLAVANSKWKVYLDHIVDGRGNEVPDFLVVEGHHSSEDRMTGVAVLPIINDQIVLLRSYRHALGTELWELPRGFIDAGETAAQAALRELTEETALTCAPENLVPLGYYAPEPATMSARGALFVATQCTGIPHMPNDELGMSSLSVFDPNAVAKLVTSGEIEDAGTLIAYYRYRARQSDE
jgi:ADP-ribose pyrophosphatase